jgi:Mn2+/Fe2+ NRAMP family transporter
MDWDLSSPRASSAPAPFIFYRHPGVEFGYKLLWAIILSGLVGIKAQSMSILLGIHRKPLMTLISEKTGRGPATIIAVYLCCLATLWILQLRAADGMAFPISSVNGSHGFL